MINFKKKLEKLILLSKVKFFGGYFVKFCYANCKKSSESLVFFLFVLFEDLAELHLSRIQCVDNKLATVHRNSFRIDY